VEVVGEWLYQSGAGDELYYDDVCRRIGGKRGGIEI